MKGKPSGTGFVPLFKESPESFLVLSTILYVRTQQGAGSLQPGRRLSAELHRAGPLILDFQVPEL